VIPSRHDEQESVTFCMTVVGVAAGVRVTVMFDASGVTNTVTGDTVVV